MHTETHTHSDTTHAHTYLYTWTYEHSNFTFCAHGDIQTQFCQNMPHTLLCHTENGEIEPHVMLTLK